MSPRAAAQRRSPEVIELNGEAVEEGGSVSGAANALRALLTDRGLHYGDGLFETLACRGGAPRLLDLHLERLAHGCARLEIEPGSLDALAADIERLASGVERALIKVIVTRGPATARGYAPAGNEQATRVVFRYGWPDEDPSSAARGVAVRIADLAIGESPRLAGLKHLNRLEPVLARLELRGSPFTEALLFSSSGSLVSGTMSNVFIAVGGELATPRLDRSGVAGVMRRAVMEAAARAGLGVREAQLTRADLDAAQELFLTNARIGVWPVCALGSRMLAPGPLTRQVQALMRPVLGGSHV
ncbi:MAG: aminodeoxychorismate lyase [Steroidobacteraceae bacterium]